MPVLFNGFPRLIDRRSLRPGRWFLSPGPSGSAVCMTTAIGLGPAARVISFTLGRLDHLEFRTHAVSALPSPLQTIEDDLVFTPGDGERPKLAAAHRRPFLSGSLLRLSNGEMGVGFAEAVGGRVHLVSLQTGAEAEGYDLAFERWSLSIRRGGEEGLVGRFRGEPRLSAEDGRSRTSGAGSAGGSAG